MLIDSSFYLIKIKKLVQEEIVLNALKQLR